MDIKNNRALMAAIAAAAFLLNAISSFASFDRGIAEERPHQSDSAMSVSDHIKHNSITVFYYTLTPSEINDDILILQHNIPDCEAMTDSGQTNGIYTDTEGFGCTIGVWQLLNDTLTLYPDIFLFPDTINQTIRSEQIPKGSADGRIRRLSINPYGLDYIDAIGIKGLPDLLLLHFEK